MASQSSIKVIESAGKWEYLLKVCHYFIANSAPDMYIREFSIKVHTKFIEENIPILTSLLDFLIGYYGNTNEKDFRKRFNLKYDQPLLRIRILDDELAKG